MTSESTILARTLIAVTALDEAMFWRNNTVLALTLDGKRHVRFGCVGSGDILGSFRGRATAIETKTFKNGPSLDQINFRRRWERAGGLYILATSESEAIAALRAL